MIHEKNVVYFSSFCGKIFLLAQKLCPREIRGMETPANDKMINDGGNNYEMGLHSLRIRT